MTDGQPSRPANIANIVAINQGRQPLTMEEPQAPTWPPRKVYEWRQEGGIVIDTRPPADFGACHVPGAYNIQLESSEFEQRIGWVLPSDEPLVLVVADTAAGREALHKLAFIGLDRRVHALMDCGMQAWLEAGLPAHTLSQVSVHTLYEDLKENKMRVLDVRSDSEWEEGHIAEAHHINYRELAERLVELSLAPDDRITVICASGLRSSTAGSILLQNDFEQVYNVTGGMNAWKAAGLPLVS
jgi:hydroxyacylglutathione hydrolase